MYRHNKVLVTGGTGTIGQELVKQLLSYDCEEIIVLSRSEVHQVEMKRKFPSVTYVIGDVRDYKVLKRVTQGISYIFHLAAIKHIDICEEHFQEALKTNILGTNKIIKAAIKNKVKRVINMSSDKAENPNSFYGMTKLMAEKLIIQANRESSTHFLNIRSGNVFGSSGSVIPLFIDQIKKDNCITLTDGKMTRYFTSVKDVVMFLLIVGESYEKGKTYSMKMSSFRMKDVADVCIDLYGNKDTKINEIGLRPGERMHEALNEESSNNNIKEKEELIKLFKEWEVK